MEKHEIGAELRALCKLGLRVSELMPSVPALESEGAKHSEKYLRASLNHFRAIVHSGRVDEAIRGHKLLAEAIQHAVIFSDVVEWWKQTVNDWKSSSNEDRQSCALLLAGYLGNYETSFEYWTENGELDDLASTVASFKAALAVFRQVKYIAPVDTSKRSELIQWATATDLAFLTSDRLSQSELFCVCLHFGLNWKPKEIDEFILASEDKPVRWTESGYDRDRPAMWLHGVPQRY